MHLNEQARAQVRPRDFWISVLVVTLALSSVGLYEIQTGHLPTAVPWMVTAYRIFEVAFLLFVWTAFLARSLRKPRQVYTLIHMAGPVGCTLVFGSDLLPHLGPATEWAKNAGFLLILLSCLSDWIRWGKRPSSPS